MEIVDKVKKVWLDIQKRTRDNAYRERKLKSYENCTICPEFKKFDVFYTWYVSQIGYDQGYEVDKDLLFKGNKHYSAENCVLLPKFLNGILTQSTSARGDMPIGVTRKEANKFRKFCAKCRYCEDGVRKRQELGCYKTPEEAFAAYKEFREAYVRGQAELWKDKISEVAYRALSNYTVSMTD